MSDKALQTLKQQVISQGLPYSYFTLAQFISKACRLSDRVHDQQAIWISALIQHEVEQGHVCLSLSRLKPAIDELGWNRFVIPETDADSLLQSSAIGHDDESVPIILDRQRLYFNRLYDNETRMVKYLTNQAALTDEVSTELIEKIDSLFADSGQINLQKLAVLNSLRFRLSIISGGPGTGKTWVVGRVLEMLQQQSDNRQVTRLAAPTGKAAARLTVSIQKMMDSENKSSVLIDKAVTLHRLLGIHRFSHQPRYHAQNPLPLDVLIIDEASMIDQQMMTLLCDAMPVHGRLILLGDKDQLASVEAGSVFADLCGDNTDNDYSPSYSEWLKQQANMNLPAITAASLLTDNRVLLKHSRRFAEDSIIGTLARLINSGDAEAAIDIVSQVSDGIQWLNQTGLSFQQVLDKRISTYRQLLKVSCASQAFAILKQFQILCAVWEGAQGVYAVNEWIEKHIKQLQGVDPRQDYYHGKPIILTSNSPMVELYNGDVGIVLQDEQGQLQVWFESSNDKPIALSLMQCPPHLSAYAITVHKSQGSEYDEVMVVLPDQISAVITRELLYTALTRARNKAYLWGHKDVLASSIKRKTLRESGLMDRLRIDGVSAA